MYTANTDCCKAKLKRTVKYRLINLKVLDKATLDWIGYDNISNVNKYYNAILASIYKF